MPGAAKREAVKLRGLRGAKYLRLVRKLVRPLRDERACVNRKLHFDDLTNYTLLHFFNPALSSMRALQQASTLRGFQERFGLPRFSLGSFSEAGRRFNPERLRLVIAATVGQVQDLGQLRELSGLQRHLTVVDSTLMRGFADMLWALWRTGEQGFKVHLEYEILRGVPTEARLTDGKAPDAQNLLENLSANRLYVLDRGFADYRLLAAILDRKSSFVVRVRSNAVCTVIEKRKISPAARKAGVTKDWIVQLGCATSPELHGRRLRIVEVRVPNPGVLLGRRPRRLPVDSKTKTFRAQRTETVLLLATDLLDLSAELIALIYRSRWQIELFFRWFKVILDGEHLLFHNPNGLMILIYCAMLASVLVVLWTGRKPTKRALEMFCHYFMGLVDDDELAAWLDRTCPAAA